MDRDDGIEEKLTPWVVARRVYARWAGLIFVWFLIISASYVGALAGFALNAANLVTLSAVIGTIAVCVGVVGAFLFWDAVSETLRKSKKARRRNELEAAMSYMDTTPNGVELTTGEKLKLVVWQLKWVLAMEAGIGFMFAIPLIVGLVDPTAGPSVPLLWLFPVLMSLASFFDTIRRNMVEDPEGILATERTERFYREAVKDQQQLAGGLVLDEHAVRAGGAPTVQAEAGGLEVHEEVALDFDGAPEAAEATSEEVASAERAVEG